MLSLAPIFLCIGTLITRPAFAVMALGLTVSLATSLGLSDAYSADFGLFVNSSLSSAAGSLLALVWTLLTRPFGMTLSLRRLLRSTWADLARTAAGRHLGDVDRLRARMIDRLAQLMPRLAASTGAQGLDGLAELRVGLSAVLLQQREAGLQPEAAARVQAVLDALQAHYERQLAQPQAAPLPADVALRYRIGQAIAVLAPIAGRHATAGDRDAAHEALHALAELKLTLCPAPAGGAPEVVVQGAPA